MRYITFKDWFDFKAFNLSLNMKELWESEDKEMIPMHDLVVYTMG